MDKERDGIKAPNVTHDIMSYTGYKHQFPGTSISQPESPCRDWDGVLCVRTDAEHHEEGPPTRGHGGTRHRDE